MRHPFPRPQSRSASFIVPEAASVIELEFNESLIGWEPMVFRFEKP
ncbi:MAG: hypothetical protein J6H18_01170 [Lachnospiraceae bacterium]|nr:hypothetical protein [Lachnospiraceae bacterium]